MLVLAVLVAGCGSGDEPGGTSAAAPPPAEAPATETAPSATAPPEEPEESAEAVPEIPRADAGAPLPHPELFFLFPAEEDARSATAELEEHGYRVRTTPPADDIPEWSVIAEGAPDAPDLSTAERAFGAWARARGGSYDGNEIPVGP